MVRTRTSKHTAAEIAYLLILCAALLFASCAHAVNTQGGEAYSGGGGSSSSSGTANTGRSGNSGGSTRSGGTTSGSAPDIVLGSDTNSYAVAEDGFTDYYTDVLGLSSAPASAELGFIAIHPLPDTLYTDSTSGSPVTWETYQVTVYVNGSTALTHTFTYGDSEAYVLENIPKSLPVRAEATITVKSAGGTPLAYSSLHAASATYSMSTGQTTIIMYVAYQLHTAVASAFSSVPGAVLSGSADSTYSNTATARLPSPASQVFTAANFDYTFQGWTLKDEPVSAANPIQVTGNSFEPGTFAGDITLYAQYLAQERLSVTYDDADANADIAVPAQEIYHEGDRVTVKFTIGTRSGFNFIGWQDNSGTLYTPGSTTSFTMGSSPVTLTAQWSDWPTVTYDDNVASEEITMPAREPCRAGDSYTVQFVATDIRTGYDFVGWKDGSGTLYSPTGTTSFTMPVTNVTLYAQWRKLPVVKYDDNVAAETITMPAETAFHPGDSVTVQFVATDIRTGYDFTGWKDSSGTLYTPTGTSTFTMPDTDVTLSAQWTKLPVVKYDDGVSSATISVPAQQAYHEGDNVTVNFTVGTRSGWRFTGWTDGSTTYTNTTTGTKTFTMPASDVTLTAQWEQGYQVTYSAPDKDATSSVPADNTYHFAGDTVTVKFSTVPARSGYRFIGWTDGTTSYKSSGTTSFTMPAANVTLSASWMKVHTVTYSAPDMDSTSSVPADSSSYSAGETVDVKFSPVPTRSGYRFTGWKKGSTTYKSDGTTSFTMGSSDVTLTAQWEKIYHVTYSYGSSVSGQTPPTDSTDYFEGDTVTVLFPTDSGGTLRSGYKLAGWQNGSSTYTNTATGTKTFTMPNSDVTLTALWKQGHSVTYNKGSGVGTQPTDTKTYYEGDTVTVKFTALTLSGKHFSGWKYGSTTYSSSGTKTFSMPDSNVTLTAQWETLSINNISVDDIKAYETNMNNGTIASNFTTLQGKIIVFKTNSGKYGAMTITGTNADNITFKWKSGTSGTPTLNNKGSGFRHNYGFDLDGGYTSDSTKDFGIDGSAPYSFAAHNGAKFYVLP